MRQIGVAERALELMCKRSLSRVAFGRTIAEQGVTRERIAQARIMIDSTRWLVLNAAYMMDTVGNKGAKAEIDLSTAEKTLTLTTDDEMKMNALWEIVQTRLVRRGVAIKNFKAPESDAAAGGAVKRVIPIQQGIPIEAAKEIVKFLKDQKLRKVQAAIQADQVRVTSPSKDELQDAMRQLREHDFGVALQFGNYR